jgi:uncharacterized membrane protein YccC
VKLLIAGPRFRAALVRSVALAIACLVSFSVATRDVTLAFSISAADDLLGGMWAVIATAFVYRESYDRSVTAALSRVSATGVSFILCLAYLLVFPFSIWGLITLIGLGSLILTLMMRPGDVVTASITTTVVLVVAGLSPSDAWLQPILRLVDTLVGVAVGVAAVWIGGAVQTAFVTEHIDAARRSS